MPKVRLTGTPFSLPKGTSQVDGNIIQKIIDIRDYELKLIDTEKEILCTEREKMNLQARKRTLETKIHQMQDELFKLYDDKILHCTVGFNR